MAYHFNLSLMLINCHSYYSLNYGTLSPTELVKCAKKLGHDVVALTDINNCSGFPEFVKVCKSEGVTPVFGIDFRHKSNHLWTGIACNREGVRELNEFLSDHNINKTPLPDKAPQFSNAFVIYPSDTIDLNLLKENEYVGITADAINRKSLSLSGKYKDRYLLCPTVTMANDRHYKTHMNLRAIDLNTLISKLKPADMASPTAVLRSADELRKMCYAAPRLPDNTMKLLSKCSINIDFDVIRNKKTFTGTRYDDKLLLEKLAFEGIHYRYPNCFETASERVEQELDIIDRLGFASYFLITWDIVRYSMSRGYYHVGRGSGANSVVAYCLKITNVDPIELDLYFERFLNPQRSTPPDFDIDYSWKERDDVQDYIFKRYRQSHTALLGTISSFKERSVYRELGKIFGLPKAEIDNFIDNPGDPSNDNSITRNIIRCSGQIANFPNIRSIHAGGVIVSEEPLTYYTAFDMPPKGFRTTQWDMYVAEELGYEKFDILSQRGIGHINDAVKIVKENRGATVDINDIVSFKNDQKVCKQLMAGESNGCFYIESPAMRGLLKKLRCNNYINLVAASSIIRPGVAKSGMMREYIKRFHNPESVEYIHPVLEKQLKETFGVMVFQEDVLKICHHFAGLDLADADVLRRAMSGKSRGKREFNLIVRKFFDNCKQFGYPESVTEEVWRQIESFAGYSFSKAHSASYAVESFQSLWLKVHFPIEFMVAVINNFGGFYRTWVYFNELKRYGASIALPCVNNSRYLTRVDGITVFIGFIHISGLKNSFAHKIVKERDAQGEYTSLEDFIERIMPEPEQMTLIIRAGALRFTGKKRAELLWESRVLMGNKGLARFNMNRLFSFNSEPFSLPNLCHDTIEDAYDELELLGFPVSISWFDMLKTSYRGDVMAKDLLERVGQEVRVLGKLVTIKYVRTAKKEIMNFAAFIDVYGEFFDTVHFPASLKHHPFRGDGIYIIRGKVIEEFGFPSIEAKKMAKMHVKSDPRSG